VIEPVRVEMKNPDHRGTEFFAALEGMRGIAALGVVFYHISRHWPLYRTGIAPHGMLFVDLFFIISGFVISHIYVTRLKTPLDLGEFALLRTARLFPLHLFTLLLVAGFMLILQSLAAGGAPYLGLARDPLLTGNTAKEFLHQLFLVQALLPHPSTFSFNRPSWSISVEYCTYYVFAIAATCLYGRKLLLLGASSLLVVVPALWLWHLGALTANDPLLRCLIGFFGGVLLQSLWQKLHATIRPRLASGWLPHLAEALCLLLIVMALWRCGYGRRQFLVIPAFAAGVLLFTLSRGWLTRSLESRPIQYLGKWSYSIYLNHFLLLLLFSDALKVYSYYHPDWHMPRHHAWQWHALGLLYIATVLAVSALTYRIVEVPPRSWAKRQVARWKVAEPAGTIGDR